MATATFIMTDHHFGRDSVTHWYDLNGIDKDTRMVFNNSRYGIEYYSRGGGFKAVVNSKREELQDGDKITKAVINTLEGELP